MKIFFVGNFLTSLTIQISRFMYTNDSHLLPPLIFSTFANVLTNCSFLFHSENKTKTVVSILAFLFPAFPAFVLAKDTALFWKRIPLDFSDLPQVLLSIIRINQISPYLSWHHFNLLVVRLKQHSKKRFKGADNCSKQPHSTLNTEVMCQTLSLS